MLIMMAPDPANIVMTVFAFPFSSLCISHFFSPFRCVLYVRRRDLEKIFQCKRSGLLKILKAKSSSAVDYDRKELTDCAVQCAREMQMDTNCVYMFDDEPILSAVFVIGPKPIIVRLSLPL